MKILVYLWSMTQLMGTYAMPTWIAVFATLWYTAVILSPGEIALIVTLSKCIDVMTDPLMACYLRKCTMHKIATIATIGSLIQSLAFVALFVPFTPANPTGGHARVLLQYAISYVIFFVGDTLAGTPNTTLGTMLKSQRLLDEQHHNDGLRIGSMMKVIGILTMGAVNMIVGSIMVSTDKEMGQEDGVMAGLRPRTNLICAIFFGAIHFLIAVLFKRMLGKYEDSTVRPEILMSRKTFLQQFSDMMTSSYNNPYFRQLIGAWACDQLTLTLMKNLLLWFVRHKVEPEMADGCEPFDDCANLRYREDAGFESGYAKNKEECKAITVAVVGVVFIIVGAITGIVFWQKKLDREKDRYGNRNVYQNWLLFNLTSALTNGLMVFVGRGDNRLFWFLCFINGLPIGGEFMTDTILLFLIAGETWLGRSDRALTQEEEAEQLDSNTTKFAMMKTFIPKAVSLVAEALPLALIQIWYREPKETCSDPESRLWFPPVNATCTFYPPEPLIFDTDSGQCTEYLSYNETGNPKFIPQKPQVSELISFFFFILPTLTCLLSYYIKSKFQITDSGEIVMLSSTKKGAPTVDSGTRREGDLIAKEGQDKITTALHGFTSLLRGRVDKQSIQALVHTLDEACEDTAVHSPRVDLKKAQSISSAMRAKIASDEWVGEYMPTTHGQFLFRLPVSTHPLAKIPVNILMFVTTSQEDIMSPWIRHTTRDSEFVSLTKGVIHGMFFFFFVPLWIITKLVVMFVNGIKYFARKLVPGLRDPDRGKLAGPLYLFGILGKRSLNVFAETVIPLLSTHIIQPNSERAVSDIPAMVRGWIHEYRNAYRRDSSSREQKLLQHGFDTVTFVGKRNMIERKIIRRLIYLRSLSFSITAVMLLIMVIILAATKGDIIFSKWSISVTVPLFLAALGLVMGTYFSGLLSMTEPDPDTGVKILDPERPLDGEGLVAIAIAHYNCLNSPGSHPLVYTPSESDDLADNVLLSGLRTPCCLSTSYSTLRDPNIISYIVFVPSNAISTIVQQLEPVHAALDSVQREANKRRKEQGLPSNVRWDVSNIAPPAAYHQYRCLLYTWEGVPPQFVTSEDSGGDRKKER
eukprot:TRINITY_DN3298_c1_g1_i1.p1 TRINITY_DN3298_c1_g1~~TRINITY_DN3298_c1_g1_i1.p1  ORF type:complete len:1153 (+),score=217.97 TRINITY_DN3298_c1_g1_i1:193-3459(+)